jgi:uncharacterized protein YraI
MESFDFVESGSGLLAAGISRRQLLKRMAGVGAFAAVGGLGLALKTGLALADDTGFYRTTSSLNLRTGPGPRRRVILVIPNNAMVTSLGQSKYGYRKVSYQGTEGWAHGDYLDETNGGSTDVPVPVGLGQTTDSVNFRNGPSMSARVFQVLKAGTTVDVFDIEENGFRMVGFANIQGWVHSDYLSLGGPLGGYVRTTAALNLREEPSTSSRVLAVMPKGATAFRGDVIANGFIGVTYNGIFGWAHMDYLES